MIFKHCVYQPHMVQHVNPKEGLSLLINYGMPMENTPEIKLLVHEPGMAPDVNSFHTSVLKLKKSYYEHIAISATQIQTTVDFDNMSYKSRDCVISNEGKYKIAIFGAKIQMHFSFENLRMV